MLRIISGRGGETRTRDTRFWRPVLYQLNYAPKSVAVRTGLEPATPCVTGRYSNQLNYRSTEFLCHYPDYSSRFTAI